jgi:S1-C subfamily serine protease
MGLVIKFLGQPYPGREVTIDDTKDEVKFGRGVDCDVGFPEDMAIVSRDHFALRRELGGYKFVINREKPVFLNGRPVYDDQDLPKSAEVQLSGPTGPKLRLERTDGGPSNQIKTEILKPQKDLTEVVRDTSTRGNRTLGIVAGVAALVAVLGAGGYFITKGLQQDVTTMGGDVANIKEQLVSISKDLPEIKAQAAAAASANPANLAAIIEKNKESVYIVSIQLPSGSRMGTGTASVVQLPDGTKALATNSHVADILADITSDPRLAGAKLVVTQPKGPDYSTQTVVSVKKHPGYDAFNAWQEKYFTKAQTLSAARMEFVPGFDVALLFVDEPEKLGTPLTYAPRNELESLKAGEQLILIGYPMEQLKGTDSARPEPTSQTGIITSLTTFFLSKENAKHDLLVQHSVPATGGASGSPMFNTKGEVVAFLNAGNIIIYQTPDGGTMRQPSGALVNYAQRADMLLDLAEGKADGLMPDYLASFDKAEDNLTKTPDVFIQDLVQLFGQEMGDQKNVTKVAEVEGVMDTVIPFAENRLGAGAEIEITEPGTYVIAGASLDKRIIQTSLYEVLPDGSIQYLDSGVNLTPYSFVVSGREKAGKLYAIVTDLTSPPAEAPPAPATAPADGAAPTPTAPPPKPVENPGKVKIWVYRGHPAG